MLRFCLKIIWIIHFWFHLICLTNQINIFKGVFFYEFFARQNIFNEIHLKDLSKNNVTLTLPRFVSLFIFVVQMQLILIFEKTRLFFLLCPQGIPQNPSKKSKVPSRNRAKKTGLRVIAILMRHDFVIFCVFSSFFFSQRPREGFSIFFFTPFPHRPVVMKLEAGAEKSIKSCA